LLPLWRLRSAGDPAYCGTRLPPWAAGMAGQHHHPACSPHQKRARASTQSRCARKFHLARRRRPQRPHQPSAGPAHHLARRCRLAPRQRENPMNSAAPQRIYDWAAFRAEIDGIRIYDDPKQVELRSRDYFWYSPILTEDIGQYVGALVVIPKDQDEV